MNRKSLRALIALFPVVLGCIPLTHMSTAPVQKPGHVEITTGVNTLTGDGSGSAFNFGLRVGVLPRVDIGLTEDALSSNVDIKIHAVTDEMAGFDLSASVGAGSSILAVYRYWNVIFSKKMNKWSPYFAFRHTYINNDRAENEDEGDGVQNIVYTLITSAAADLNQFFAGAEYAISEKTYFVVEGMFLPSEESQNLTAINAGFKFKF